MIKEKVLALNLNNNYLKVSLVKDGTKTKHLVHRLVAKTFLSDYSQDGLIVAHNNSDSTDNRLENLRWATQKRC